MDLREDKWIKRIKRTEEERDRMRRDNHKRDDRGERKKYKIINRRGTVIMHKIIGINRKATVIVHICTVIVAIVHKCTFLHPLMWVFFYSKCVK